MNNATPGGLESQPILRHGAIFLLALQVVVCACSTSSPPENQPDAGPDRAGELPADSTHGNDWRLETVELIDAIDDEAPAMPDAQPSELPDSDLSDLDIDYVDDFGNLDIPPTELDLMDSEFEADVEIELAETKDLDELSQACEGIVDDAGECCDPAAACKPEGQAPLQCGSDGCGGSCGECEEGWLCDEAGQCNPDCDWWCQTPQCGSPVEGCLCGTCEECGETCVDGVCQFTACAEKECGSDGCGSFCGICEEGLKCDGGTCIPKSMTWVAIPPGDYMMGCSPGDVICDTDEHPVHPVAVSAFYMLETPVTESQYEMVMNDDPSCNFNGAYGENYPVECVTWDQSKEFCLAVGGRLCTEAEWEYAARAGTTTKYYCGDDEACLDDIAWTGLNSGEKKHAVKLKLPNEFGLYDILGNVFEWVEDCWHGTYAGAPEIGYPAWMNNCSSDYRALRGGSWLHPDPHLSRASSRYPYPTDYIFNFLGVRCCRSVD